MRRLLLAALFLALFCSVLPSTAQEGLVTCPGFMPLRLSVGTKGRVTPGSSNNIRSTPSTTGEKIGKIPGKGEFTVLDGPTCAENTAWWQVEYEGIVGWTVEGMDGEYWLEPLNDTGSVCASIFSIGDMGEIRQDYGSDGIFPEPEEGRAIAEIKAGEQFEVTGVPVCLPDEVWIPVRFNGEDGWFKEAGYPVCPEMGCGYVDNGQPIPLELFARHPFLPLETVVPTDGVNPLLPQQSSQLELAANAISSTNTNQLTTLEILGEGFLTDFAWSLDEKQIVVSSSLNAKIYTVTALNKAPHLLIDSAINRVQYCPDGKILATAGNAGDLRLWDTESYNQISVIDHGNSLKDIQFSPDGSLLAVLTENNFRTALDLWDVEDVANPTRRAHYDVQVNSLRFTSDGVNLVAMGCQEIHIYNLTIGKTIDLETGFTCAAYDADDWVISGDNEAIVANINDQVGDTMQSYSSFVSGWSIATGEYGYSPFQHQFFEFNSSSKDSGLAMTLTPDGDNLLVTAGDEQLMLNPLTMDIYHEGFVRSMVSSPDGVHVAFGTDQGGVRLYTWQSSSRELNAVDTLYGIQGDVNEIRFSPAGTYVAAQGADNSLRVWQVDSHQRLGSIQLQTVGTAANDFILSRDEQTIFFPYMHTIWNLQTGQQERTLKFDEAIPEEFASSNPDIDMDTLNPDCSSYQTSVSEDGSLVACVMADADGQEVTVINLRTGSVVLALQRYFHSPAIPLISPDNRLLMVYDYSTSNDNTGVLTLWEIATGHLLTVLNVQDPTSYSLQFSPDGRKIAWSFSDFDSWKLEDRAESSIHLYDFATLAEQWIPMNDAGVDNSRSPREFILTKDGSIAIVGLANGNIDLFDTANGNLLTTLNGHLRAIDQLTLSEDGARLYTSAEDGTLRVWGIPAP